MTKGKSCTASDLMVRQVVTVSPEASVREALDLMQENHVSGLPVLDGRDRCVGLVSSSDILSLEHDHASRDDETLGAYFDSESQRWETMRVAADDERLADVTVDEIMTRSLVSVRPKTPAREIAQRMAGEEVHRVLVLDAEQGLHGIVSAFDIVRLVAQSELL